MSTPTPEAPPVAEAVDGETPAVNKDESPAVEEVNWQERFEHLQKVNRDLEKKVKGEAGTLRDQVAELQAKIEGKEKEYAAEQERRKVEMEALSKANQRILKAEIRAQATAKLADPADALLYLDMSSFEVGDDGEVDAQAITAAIDDLIASKPYLAAQGRRFQGGADGGARKDSAPAQLTRADLGRMSPDEIVKAKAEGRLNDLLGIK